MFPGVALGACYFMVIANVTMIVPVLPFTAHEMHMDNFMAGGILTIFPIVALPANLVIGPVADRVGRRRLLLAGAVGCSAIYLLSALSSSGLQMLLLRAATGITMSMVGCSVFSSIADYYPPASRVRITGYVSSSASWAQLLGVPLAAFIAESFGWRLSFLWLAGFAAAVAAMVCALPSPRYVDETSTRSASASDESSPFLSRPIIAILTGYGLYSCGIFIFVGLLPTWIAKNSQATAGGHDISAIFLASGIGGLLGSFIAGSVGNGSLRPASLRAILAASTGLMLLPIPFAGLPLVVGSTCFAIASVLRAVLLPNLITNAMALVLPSRRGKMNGLLAAAFQVGTATGGVMSSWLYSLDGSYAGNTLVALGFFLGSMMAFMLSDESRHASLVPG